MTYVTLNACKTCYAYITLTNIKNHEILLFLSSVMLPQLPFDAPDWFAHQTDILQTIFLMRTEVHCTTNMVATSRYRASPKAEHLINYGQKSSE